MCRQSSPTAVSASTGVSEDIEFIPTAFDRSTVHRFPSEIQAHRPMRSAARALFRSLLSFSDNTTKKTVFGRLYQGSCEFRFDMLFGRDVVVSSA